MKKILLISSVPRSLINFRGPLIEALQRQGLNVHVLAPDLGHTSPYRATLEGRGCTVHTMPLQRTGLNPLFDLWTLLSILIVIVKIRPAHTLAYNIKPVIYGSIAAFIARVPRRFVLITGIGSSFTSEKPVSFLIIALYRLALWCSNVTFFQNSDDEALFIEMGIARRPKDCIVVNGSGVDLNYFSPVELPQKPLHFLMIARLLKSKGVEEYIKAAERLKQKYPQVQFKLVGWIDENPEAITEIELNEWVKNGPIEFLGKLEDVRPAIASSHVYVLPSYREGTPRTVLEAMAMGRPIVTTDAPGCRETVQNGINGFLVPTQDSESLENAMERFIIEPELVLSMGAASLELAKEKYDVNKVNDAMLRGMGVY